MNNCEYVSDSHEGTVCDIDPMFGSVSRPLPEKLISIVIETIWRTWEVSEVSRH